MEESSKLEDTIGTAAESTNANLETLCDDMFDKCSRFLHGELKGTISEYDLLNELNTAAVVKYSDMATLVSSLNVAMVDINQKYALIQPYLKKIDELDESISKLEKVATRLDSYSRRLETKYKKLARG